MNPQTAEWIRIAYEILEEGVVAEGGKCTKADIQTAVERAAFRVGLNPNLTDAMDARKLRDFIHTKMLSAGLAE